MAVPTSQLEKESRRMEERLGMLREMMRAEKRKRRIAGDSHWRSARPGPLQPKAVQSSAGDRSHEKGCRPVRVKVLTGQKASSKVKASSKSCGQCDKFSASLVCVECAESYCSVCFAKFHQKGALSRHHVRPLVCKLPADTAKPAAVEGTAVGEEEGGGRLLQGTYDEASSAAAFQEALAAWRGEGAQQGDVACNTSVLKATGSSTHTSSGTQADVKTTPPKIQFSSHTGVSYFEKLMVRWYRVEPLLPVHRGGREEHESKEDLPSNSSVSQYNLFYSTDDLPPLVSSDVCSVSEEPEGTQIQSQKMPAEIGMVASVRLAWADNSHRGNPGDQLTRFFLSGVEGADALGGVAESPRETGSKTADQPTYSTSHWLPSASITPSGGAEHVTHDVTAAMELPPVGLVPCPVGARDSEDSSSDSELLMEEGEGAWEECERERCDSQALESLAYELASRASQVDNGAAEEQGSPVDMGRVTSEFELYQQQLMELDS